MFSRRYFRHDRRRDGEILGNNVTADDIYNTRTYELRLRETAKVVSASSYRHIYAYKNNFPTPYIILMNYSYQTYI